MQLGDLRVANFTLLLHGSNINISPRQTMHDSKQAFEQITWTLPLPPAPALIPSRGHGGTFIPVWELNSVQVNYFDRQTPLCPVSAREETLLPLVLKVDFFIVL